MAFDLDQGNGDAKSPFLSKTIHFNLVGIIAAALWPFLPPDVRHNEHAVQAITAWLTLGNVVIRFFTTKAISFGKKDEKPKT